MADAVFQVFSLVIIVSAQKMRSFLPMSLGNSFSWEEIEGRVEKKRIQALCAMNAGSFHVKSVNTI